MRLIRRKLARPDGSVYSPLENKYAFPLYTLLHPVDGFAQFKPRQCQSWLVAGILLALLFLTELWAFFGTGFAFSMRRAIDFNMLVMLLKTLLLFALFVTANWGLCTLLNGKGTFKDIFCTVSYALVPYIAATAINTVLSHLLCGDEGVYMTVISVIGILWSVLLLICGLYAIHEYSVLQTVGSILLTLVGAAIIAFFMILFYTLMQQVVSFASSLLNEILKK